MAEIMTYDVNGEEAQEFSDFFQEHQWTCPHCKKMFNPETDKPAWSAFTKLLDDFAKKIYRIGRESKK